MKKRGVRIGLTVSLVLVACVAVSLLLSSCGGPPDPWADVPGGEPRVLASFPPIYCFAKNVAGDEVAVLSMLTTVGPHDFKPNNQDAMAVRKARVYFANGLGLDDSLSKVVHNAASPALLEVNVGNEGVPKDRRIKIGKVKHGDHWHAGSDPHAWLGIEEAIGMVEVIRDRLKEVDPQRAAGYDERAAAYIARLNKLHDEGKEMLKGKQNRNLVTNHGSMAYFARSFDLKIVGHLQEQPGVAVDGRTLEELAALCKEHQVRVLAVEPQFPQGNVKMLQEELERNNMTAAVVELDPLETADPRQLDAGFYERGMRKNLETLAKHLP
jgi:ABC-type Zn uptake system ZnuABC Zn-binding protein ZnuA